ncbi:MAG: pyridoxine 5'-phosphate synthase [Betaproteobacteria bacterium]|jgi:pyridoxine 5-phosphate synthase|nr:pyridoxine 5'-phosphate synthase [Betaproteobacteria bacterium]
MSTALSVNLNKIALVRNSRPLSLNLPDVTMLGEICLRAGAHGLTVHPRPDERHIRADDVAPLAQLVRRWPGREYNIEGNPFHNLMDHVRATRPDQATFVPDALGQVTSDHGWDLNHSAQALGECIARAREWGVRVSLFVDPDPSQMPLAKALGADRVELYTEPYARAHGTDQQAAVLQTYRDAALAAKEAGLGINAGHDLNLINLGDFLQAVPGVLEVSIGHALLADALVMGYDAAVKAYNAVIAKAHA